MLSMQEDPRRRGWLPPEELGEDYVEPPPRHPDFNWPEERERLNQMMIEANNPHSVLEYILKFPKEHAYEAYWEDFLVWVGTQTDELLKRASSGVPDIADETVIALLNTATFLTESDHHHKLADKIEEKVLAFWTKNPKLFFVGENAIPHRLGLRISSLSKMVYTSEMSQSADSPRNLVLQAIARELAFEVAQIGFTEEDRKEENPFAFVDLSDFQTLILSTLEPAQIEELAKLMRERHGAEFDLRTQRLPKASKLEKERAEVVHLRNWIWSVMELEAHAPGAAKELQHRFGIINFNHYESSILKDMYDNRDANVPYGLIIGTQYDWNDAMSGAGAQLLQISLHHQLMERGVHIRIIEVASPRSLAKHLLTLDKTYGAKNKISFAIVQGHGGEEDLQLGNKYGQTLSKRQLKRLKPGNASRFFVEKPPVVMDSCNTAAPDGLAEEIARLLGGKTQGAENVSYGIKEITVSGDASHLQFDVELRAKKEPVGEDPRLRIYEG